MRKQIFITLTILFFVSTLFLNITAQENSVFKSGEGSFKINLPKKITTSRDQSFKEGNVVAYGKFLEWADGQRIFQVQFFKLVPDAVDPITQKDKSRVLNAFTGSLVSAIKNKNIPFQENSYTFEKSVGKEVVFIIANRKVIYRNVVVGKRLYSIGASFTLDQDEAEITKILNSFGTLNFKEIYDTKLAEAEPKPLPQEPSAKKLKSDTEDKNLKGKVKSVIEYTQESSRAKKEISSEAHFDENGNLTREIEYDEGYPLSITVWGNIDGNRVTRTESIYFDDDQRPPRRNMILLARIDSEQNSNAPRDERYQSKHEYKYDENGILIEKINYENNGQVINRTVYNRKENQIEEINFDNSDEQISKTVKILDKNGNVIEERFYNENDKVSDKNFITLEYDSKGNWIVEKTFESSKVRGKSTMKLLWMNTRTITYYP